MNQKQKKPGNPPHTTRQALPSFETAGVVEKKINNNLKSLAIPHKQPARHSPPSEGSGEVSK